MKTNQKVIWAAIITIFVFSLSWFTRAEKRIEFPISSMQAQVTKPITLPSLPGGNNGGFQFPSGGWQPDPQPCPPIIIPTPLKCPACPTVPSTPSVPTPAPKTCNPTGYEVLPPSVLTGNYFPVTVMPAENKTTIPKGLMGQIADTNEKLEQIIVKWSKTSVYQQYRNNLIASTKSDNLAGVIYKVEVIYCAVLPSKCKPK